MGQVWLYSLSSVAVVSVLSLIGVITLGIKQDRLQKILFYLVSFSTGALLGDVFLHILPEIMEGEGALRSSAYVLTGIVIFYIFERLLLWQHSHTSHREDIHSVAYLTIFGDALHNLLDGIAIAASFLISIPVGLATTAAVIFHEIPQEMSEFAILVHGGFSRKKALFFNFLSALTAIVGALLVLVFSRDLQEAPVFLLSLSAASFIYIAMADLIPELQRESNTFRSIIQLLCMLAGIGVMGLLLTLE